MSLIRYTPYVLNNLQQQVNRVFDEYGDNGLRSQEVLSGGTFAPPMDVKEDDDAYTVQMEVPGVKQEDLNLTLQENVVTIRGQKAQRSEEDEGNFRRIERSYGAFARSVTLPRPVDGNAVTAKLSDGVLEVRLPKMEEAKPRQIGISTGQETA